MTTKTKVFNVESLREILADEIQKIRTGKTTAANINAITNAAGKIFQSVKLEMEYAKMIGKKPDIKFIKLTGPKTRAIE